MVPREGDVSSTFPTRGSGAWLAPAAVVAVLAALALALIPASAGAQGMTKAAAAKQRLLRVVKPHDDVLMRGRQLQVRLRLARGAKLHSATLGERGVKRFFHPAGSARVLVATLDKRRLGKALPKGRNFLHVVVRRRGGVDSETISFTRVLPSKQLVTRFRAGFQPRFGLRATVEPTRATARVRVTLNGRNVSRQFRKGTPLRRGAAGLGASDGLRHGANRLRVLVWDYHGEYRLLRRTIRVGRQTTIAGAGPDRRLRAGGKIRLDGRKTKRALRRSGKLHRGKLHFRWTLRHKPRGSKARLSRRNHARPVLRTDLPGSYRLELRSFQRGPGGGAVRSTSVDSAEVKAEPQPLVPVSTFAEAGGVQGIRVDVDRDCEGAKAAAKPPCFYPNKGKPSDLQVVVLDRETLEPVSNNAYSTNDLHEFASAMAKYATKLEPKQGQKCLYAYDTDKLVLIALREGQVADQTHLDSGLSYFGTSTKDCSPEPLEGDFAEGPYSVIAVPGTLAGKATNNNGVAVVGPHGTGKTGSLDGYLKVAADNPTEVAATRSFEFATEIPFDTRAEGGKAVRIGETSLPIAASPAGLLVFQFDASNPSKNFSLVKTITNVGGNPDAGLEWSALAETLHRYVQAGHGVMVVSNGKIGGFATEPDASSFPQVLRELERLAANPDTFARAVAQNGTYSLIATVALSDNAVAYDSSSAVAAGVPDYPNAPASSLPVNQGRVTGVLHRGPDLTVFPAEVDPSGLDQHAELRSLLFEEDVEWQLTPAPETGSAGCQQTAFAYIVEQVGQVFAKGTAPKLWEDARARGCQGIPHPATGAGRSADSLEGDGCASQEGTAVGAKGANVRTAAMALRDKYTSLTYELSEAEVLGVSLPAGAPFTAADLACAKNQLIDELAARRQAEKLFEVLRKPEQNLQGETVVDLGRIAEEVKSGALSSIASRLNPEPAATPSVWASLGPQLLNAVPKLASMFMLYDPEVWAARKVALELASSAAQAAIIGATAASPSNPAAAADEYILLASQIEQQEVDVEAQIVEALTAQQNGATRALEAVESDPRRLAVVAAKARGEWGIDAHTLEAMQQAYSYRVTQLAYELLLPQAFQGVRFNYTHAFQIVDTFTDEWNDNAWIPETGTARALAWAKEPTCGLGVNLEKEPDLKPPFPAANPGTPPGLGQGNEYQAQVAVVPKDDASPRFLDYVMVVPETIGGFPTVASYEMVAPIFEQPVAPNGAVSKYAAGLYAPGFWYRNMGLDQTMHCNMQYPRKTQPKMVAGPTERLAFGSGDLWPTPTNTAHK